MKLNRALFIVPVVAAAALSSFMFAQDKQKAALVGYLDADALIAAHPKYSKIQDMQKSAEKELTPIADKIKALEAKVKDGSASSKEQADYKSLVTSYNELRKKWADKSQKEVEPITNEINGIISKYARKNGFAMILDFKVAAQSGLILYADTDLNLTDQLVAEVK